MSRQYDVIVIGAGQAGLAMGYYLAQQGRKFLIIDGGTRVGDTWRKRWDSLKLFTPAGYSNLPGFRFPAEANHYPTAVEVADYLEEYAAHFDLPVRMGEPVLRLARIAGDCGYIVQTVLDQYVADQVVVATGPFQRPFVPSIAADLASDVLQLHSSEYRRPEQIFHGDVVVVGGGNSGVQIAAELATYHKTHLSIGKSQIHMPDRFLGRSIFSWLEKTGVMNVPVTSRIGRRASQKEYLVGESYRRVSRTFGVELAGRTLSASGDRLMTEQGKSIKLSTVIWATGYRSDYSWIDVPVFNLDGRPEHHRGVTQSPGLYFLGLAWMHTRGSALLGWVGRDAQYLAQRIGEQHQVVNHRRSISRWQQSNREPLRLVGTGSMG
jgi:putative flavoprotein involved in K+ transport